MVGTNTIGRGTLRAARAAEESGRRIFTEPQSLTGMRRGKKGEFWAQKREAKQSEASGLFNGAVQFIEFALQIADFFFFI